MSYVNQANSSGRFAAIAGTGAVQLIVAGGLIFGLTITGAIPEVVPYNPPHEFILPPPPKPVEKTVEPKPDTSTKTVVPVPKLPIPRPTPELIDTTPDLPPIIEVVTRTAGPITIIPPTHYVEPKLPDPPPAFDPVGPMPKNGPLGWITTEQYPSVALRRGWEGNGNYLLTIGTNGRVTDCSITTSTGRDVLDRATCKSVKRRARFDPAMNSSGEKVSGTYSGKVTWRIPD